MVALQAVVDATAGNDAAAVPDLQGSLEVGRDPSTGVGDGGNVDATAHNDLQEGAAEEFLSTGQWYGAHSRNLADLARSQAAPPQSFRAHVKNDLGPSARA